MNYKVRHARDKEKRQTDRATPVKAQQTDDDPDAKGKGGRGRIGPHYLAVLDMVRQLKTTDVKTVKRALREIAYNISMTQCLDKQALDGGSLNPSPENRNMTRCVR